MATKYSILLALAVFAQAQTDNNNDGTTTAAANTGTQGAQKTTAATQTGDGQSVSVTDLPNLSTAPSVGAATSVTVTDAPTISSSIFHLSDVPTIAGYGVPTQMVPWTAGAPFMQTSKLPEGTVFIIVGAILGFLGAAILAWRGMIAWSLHRSVKRAALGSQYSDSMLKLSKPTMGVNAAAMGSNMSLDRLSTPAGKLSKTHARNNSGSTNLTNAAAARNSSLFFSPTAGAGAHHTTPSAALIGFGANNRSSPYLPAGYYAAPGTAAPASGNKHASVGTGAAARLSSLNPMHPSSKGYTQQPDFAPSPPDSPRSTPIGRPSTGGTSLGTRRGYERVSGLGERETWSNLHIPGGAPAGQRAPSANLEDLFEEHGGAMKGA
jgi:hypothetical protein